MVFELYSCVKGEIIKGQDPYQLRWEARVDGLARLILPVSHFVLRLSVGVTVIVDGKLPAAIVRDYRFGVKPGDLVIATVDSGFDSPYGSLSIEVPYV